MRKAALGSVAFVRFRTDSAKAPTLIFDRLTRKQEVERIAMSTRRRFKQVICLKDRLIQKRRASGNKRQKCLTETFETSF
jgi:hypothetical protein